MTAGQHSRIVTSARRLRQRWLEEPSPPLAVDDEPLWTPAPDVAGAGEGPEQDLESPAGASAV